MLVSLHSRPCRGGLIRATPGLAHPRRATIYRRHHHLCTPPRTAAEEEAPTTDTDSEVEAELETKSEEYTDVMQQRMGTVLTYRHEDGMNYTRILDDLIVGSCLQLAEDVDTLAEKEKVGTVLSLQENCDMEYFSLDLAPIQERCKERGDIAHCRFPVRDFDPFSLRQRLPSAVAVLASEARKNGGTSYVHCTAGLGRAPGVALAYMWWVKRIPLDEAFELLRSKRPCSPKLFAIRQAAVDLLYGGEPTPVSIAVYRRGFAQRIQLAGLDVGWGNQLDLQVDPATHRFMLKRSLLPGKYQFKFIVDGNWTYSADHNTLQDGDNINNYIVVEHRDGDPAAAAARERLLQDGGLMTEEEHEKIVAILDKIAADRAAAGIVEPGYVPI